MTWPLAAVIVAGMVALTIAFIAPLVVVSRLWKYEGEVWTVDPLPPPTPPPPLPPRPNDQTELTWPQREVFEDK